MVAPTPEEWEKGLIKYAYDWSKEVPDILNDGGLPAETLKPILEYGRGLITEKELWEKLIYITLEYASEIQTRLDFVLQNSVKSPDGRYTFPDGTTLDCGKE